MFIIQNYGAHIGNFSTKLSPNSWHSDKLHFLSFKTVPDKSIYPWRRKFGSGGP